MYTIGITGGVGSGKSTILNYLSTQYHVRVIKADEVGQLLTLPGHKCYEPVVEEFTDAILKKDGTIDRKELARIVYSDRSKLEKLNAIIHPEVKKYILKELEREEKEDRDFVFIEAALLIEDGYKNICDEIWYVFVSEEDRIERLVSEREYTEEKCRSIFANQCTEDEFRAECDFEIDNSKTQERTYAQIDTRMKSYETL
ncbi:MAG: dephospho-CoA kinase [Lachnospiraceae bacterium]|jgi:dephospho-CoA kinase|nr:dephospho-CoA kinase [Lachnospiraceae bacterium]MDD3615014.1 dephospho-CoA kinase [Lachnospiraceae bacterium]